MARWRVRLDGEAFDLEDLPGMFTSPDLAVVVDEDAFYLESARFEALSDPATVQAEARRLVAMMNGAARVVSSTFRNVSVGANVIEFGPDGQRRHAVLLAGVAEMRAKAHGVAIVVGGEEPEPPVGSHRHGGPRRAICGSRSRWSSPSTARCPSAVTDWEIDRGFEQA